MPRITIITFDGIISSSHGTAKRSLVVAEIMAKLGFQVTILSLDNAKNIPESSILPSQIKLVRLPSRIPFLLGWKGIRLINSIGKNSDALIVESALLLLPTKLAKLKNPIIWDTLEFETLHYRRLPPTPHNSIKRFIWWILEQWSIKQADVIVAIGSVESKWWATIFPKSRPKLMIADHSVGFSPIKDMSSTNRDDADDRPMALFIGNLSAKHNKLAVDWIIKELAPRVSSKIRLVIAGAGSELLPPNSHVDIKGYVANIDSLVLSASLCIAPLATGAGVKTKILHYVSLQKVVIATPIALEGIDDIPGVISSPLDSFASKIIDFFDEPENLANQILRKNQQTKWYEEHCGENHTTSQWKAILLRVNVAIP